MNVNFVQGSKDLRDKTTLTKIFTLPIYEGT